MSIEPTLYALRKKLSNEIRIEVAYARAERQEIIALAVPLGITVAEAIARSRITEQFPEIDLTRNRVGIFGKLTHLETVVRDQDRIEIYRLLPTDPKERRRQRAKGTK